MQHLRWQRLLLVAMAVAAAAVGVTDAVTTMAENATYRDFYTKKVVDEMLRNYTRQNSPNGDSPTYVKIGIYIIGFYSISEATMDYALTIYLRQKWRDPRLAFNSSRVGGKTKIKLEDKIWDKIWVPDIFLRNEKKAGFHEVTIPNRFMNLQYDGEIWYVIKLSMTLSCEMNLKKYPLDTQFCPMMFESFGHTMDTVVFDWLGEKNVTVQNTETLTMPQFHLRDVKIASCNQNYTTGAYPCLQIIFELKRDFGYFLLQIYVPTSLIVILSWVAFWLNIEAVPARVSLGLLTVLTITTQASSAKSSLPKVSYIKAIDVWMSVCLAFVFLSLLEFSIVNVYSRHDKEVKAKQAKRNKQRKPAGRRRGLRLSSARAGNSSPVFFSDWRHRHAQLDKDKDTSLMLEEAAPLAHSPTPESQQQQQQQPQPPPPQAQKQQPPSLAKRVDKFSRRFFPLTFILFNVVYWVYYLIVA